MENAIEGCADRGGAQGYRCLEQEVLSHMEKRRDTEEGWMAQETQATTEVNSDGERSDLGHREGSKQRGSGTAGLAWAQQ